jgi:hypothetical protein
MNALAFAYKLWTDYEALSRMKSDGSKVTPLGNCRERRHRRPSSVRMREGSPPARLTENIEARVVEARMPESGAASPADPRMRDASDGRGGRG